MSVTLLQGDCLDLLPTLEAGSVDLIITSPPYFNLREYAQWETYEAHLADVARWLAECYRVLKPGRHLCWNIQPYLPAKRNGERYHQPLSADTIVKAYQVGFGLERTLIWDKPNAVCQRMFGSYPYPPTILYTPSIEDIHVFRKPGQADLTNKSAASQISKVEWAAWTLPIWRMSIGYKRNHAAQFPVELPTRLIRLHSFIDDTVLDPFMGSGTTGAACITTDRNFIGMERDPGYFQIARDRIAATQPPLLEASA